ncbi:hypothetical protein AVEN_49686-1 [Araneus ventricosus]|uniref:Uncharacterized protein n=1 Tax=Araneus ventricosus TaxID=182803 RepID=A0A4Y2SSE5_ARAVE|nr:hypothetical protein AVEN_49686-1 [Araneus ventricosus]
MGNLALAAWRIRRLASGVSEADFDDVSPQAQDCFEDPPSTQCCTFSVVLSWAFTERPLHAIWSAPLQNSSSVRKSDENRRRAVEKFGFSSSFSIHFELGS